jgi:PAS domain S-box-containing protein
MQTWPVDALSSGGWLPTMGRSVARACSRGANPYLVAIGCVGVAVLGRLALGSVAPATGPYVLTFPAIVLAGMFCGTRPAIVAAAVAGLLTYGLMLEPTVSPHLSNTAVLDTILFGLACAPIIWATQRMRLAVASAETAEARLAETFRQVPGAAAILQAPDGRLLINSRRSTDILGHPPRREMGDYGGIHADGSPMSADAYPITRALRTGEEVAGEHVRYRRPDGRIITLEIYAGPVCAADGHIVAAVGMAFDVTERIAAQQRLHESEAQHRALAQRLRESETQYRTVAERLRTAIDAGGFGVWELDLVSRFTSMDATMAAMLGRPPEPVVLSEAETRALIHPADYPSVRDRMNAAIVSGETYADECRMLTPKGQVRWVVSHGAVMADIRKVIGVVRDVTQRREREDALRAALAARDVLMREADHRIKNSLQLVASLLSVQQSKTEDLSTRQALGGAIARVQAIANTHLALERSPDLRMIDVDTMLGDLCERVGVLNPAVEIRCVGRSDTQLDAEQAIPLGLIASELLTNALRHAYTAGETGWASLSIAAEDGGLRMVVADGGRGMPAGPRRLGLGSSVIAALGRQIGASVATNTLPGEGTVIAVWLPLPATAGITACVK